MSNRAQQVIRAELDEYLASLERRVKLLEERLAALEGLAEKHRLLETRVARLDDDVERMSDEPEGPSEGRKPRSGFRYRAVR